MDRKDNGYKSRKMVMAYVVMGTGALGWLATAWKTALAVTYTEFCMFLLGAASIYIGSNVAVKWTNRKALKKKAAPVEEAAPEPKE